MDDLQRAQRLLNSPIEGDHRKAIKLLAKSGDRRALALLRQAYDNAQSAETKQMALKGGAYLKENLRAEVLAPAADPITFDLPEDHYGLDGLDTPAIQPDITADWMTSAVKGESKAQTKARKRKQQSSREGNKTERIASVFLWIFAFILIVGMIAPWVTVDELMTYPNITVRQELESVMPKDTPHTGFSSLSISSVLQGQQSPWWAFLTTDQFNTLYDHSRYLHMSLSRTNEYAGYADGIVGYGALMIVLLINVMAVALVSKGDQSNGWAFRGVLRLLIQHVPSRILWLLALLFSILYGATIIIFLFDVLPRFIPAITALMALENGMYQTYELLDYGFFISSAAMIAILITTFIGLTSYDTPTSA